MSGLVRDDGPAARGSPDMLGSMSRFGRVERSLTRLNPDTQPTRVGQARAYSASTTPDSNAVVAVRSRAVGA